MADQQFDVLKIVRDALDTDPGTRDDFVSMRCGADTQLHERVDAMLKRIAAADSADENARPESTTPTRDADPADALVGQMLGPFRIAERIGRGGMGIVYRGEREGADFAQEVAIKLIRRGYDFDDVHARFLRERRILARLSHPNLARFIDGGVTEERRPWFALEFVRGQSITSWCDSRKLTVRSRLQLFVDVCGAVQYAHTRLVIHRDLKPGNVLVDETGAVRLLDFGVAGLIAGDGDDDNLASTIGIGHALTPEYAAPEQFTGAVAGVSADVYSLGVLAYELISGVLPFAMDRHDHVSAAHIVATTPPQPLSAAIVRVVTAANETEVGRRVEARRTNVRAFRRVVRGDLGRIIEKALAKEPERRYQTAQAFADDLSRWLVGAPVHVTGNRLGYRVGKFVQRNRVAVSLGGLAFALLVAGAVGIVWKSREALLEAERANVVKAFVLSLFDSNAPGGAVDNVPSTRDLLNRGVERAQTEMRGQPLLRAEMLTTLGRIHNQLGLYDEADPLLRQAIKLEEGESATDPSVKAGTLRELAQSLSDRQRYKDAVMLLDKALPLVDESNGIEEALIRQLLGIVLTADHDNDRGLRESEAAIALWRGIERPAGERVANAFADYGTALTTVGKLEESLIPYADALATLRSLHDGVHSDIAIISSNIGVSLMMLGRFEAALGPLREAVAVDRKVYSGAHRALAGHLANLGAAEMTVGQLEDGEKAMRESVAVRTTLYGAHSAETAKSQINLGVALTRLERHAEIEQLMRSAIASLDKTPGDWRRWIAIAKSNLASALMHQGRTKDARVVADAAVTFYSESDRERNSIVALNLQSQLGEIALLESKPEEAKVVFLELLDRSLANLPANTSGLPDRYEQLARAELETAQLDAAEIHFQKSIDLETKRAGSISPTMVRARLGLADTLIKMGDKPAALEQLSLLKSAIEALPAGHSQRKRALQLEMLLKHQAN